MTSIPGVVFDPELLSVYLFSGYSEFKFPRSFCISFYGSRSFQADRKDILSLSLRALVSLHGDRFAAVVCPTDFFCENLRAFDRERSCPGRHLFCREVVSTKT